MKKVTITSKQTAAKNTIPYRRRKYMDTMRGDSYVHPVMRNLPKARNNVNHIKNRAEEIKNPLFDIGNAVPSLREIFPWLRMVYMIRMASIRLVVIGSIYEGTPSCKCLVADTASFLQRFISLSFNNGG